VADDYPQIYTTIGEEKLAVNALPATSTVPMGFQAETSGTYTINAIETSEFTEIYLEDLVTGETTDLLSDSYTFDYVAGTTADRFVIHFGALGVENSNAYNVNIWSNENNIMVNAPSVNGTIVVYNMMGQEMTRTDIAPGVNVIPMDEVNTYYVVKVLTSDSAITGKVFIK
ncbi:MAG: T9SS type A sorting domain-containing protein, partial [Bacteroidales bacterium]|nr:T9SS type A sorting domain-containing protein [Bacteroidales bacterium]